MSSTALVTGANQGLGQALVEGLARALGEQSSVYLTGRDPRRVEDATGVLASSGLRVVGQRLDVGDTEEVQAVAALLAERHGGLDIVISNAAARRTPEQPASQQVRAFVDTNNLGTTRMIRAFGPLVRGQGRFLIVASAFGSLRNLAPHLHARFDTETMTLEDVDAVMRDYVAAVESGRATAQGWPESINTVSKIGQVAAMRVFAREERARAARDGQLIAAVCPGLIDTPASRPWFADMSEAQTPEQAAVDIVDLAIGRVEPPMYGELIQHRRILPWL